MPKKTKFVFTDDSYWENPGCDCCESTLMEAYNSDDIYCGSGTAWCVEACYIQAIKTFKGESGNYSHLWELNLDQLEEMADNLGIEVVIEGLDPQGDLD